MAKNYSAQIAIKEGNSIATLKKVVSATEKLKKNLEAISNKPITIDAKMGSSFKNVQAQINKVAPKSKKIHFEATENVTKTMSTVNRQVFEMNKNIKTGLQGAMKGFNTSLNATLPKMQALSNAMALGSNVARMANMASASALGAAGAGMGTAAILKGKDKDRDKNNLNTPTNKLGIIDNFKAKASKMASVGIDYGKKFSKGFKDAVENTKIKYNNGVIGRFINTEFNKNGIFGSDGSGLASMVEKQKDKLSSLGVKNPLSQWKDMWGQVGPEDDIFLGVQRDWQGVTTKILAEGNEVFREIGQNAKENLSKAGEAIKNKWNNNHMVQMARYSKEAFSEIKTSAIKSLTPLGNKIKQLAYQFKFACDRGKYFFTYFATGAVKKVVQLGSSIKTQLTKAFNSVKSVATRAFNMIPEPLKKGMSRAWSSIKSGASRAASSIKSTFGRMASSVASSVTKSIGGAFTKVVGMAKSAAKAAGAAFVAAIGIGANSMMNQEQNLVSMKHFLKVGDAKANGSRTKSDDQINEEANKFISDLTNLANNTPFDNDDIYASGRRMLQVFEGNSEMAMKMTNLSADMAALNPGKTAQDAAEALADLAMGETERMKEFGFKFSQDQLKEMIGKTDDSPLTSSETMKAFAMLTGEQGELTKTFGGGASDISKTTKGMFSTMWGSFKQMMADSMKPFDGMMKSSLGKMTNYIKQIGPSVQASFGQVANFMGDLFAGDSSRFPMVENLINAFNTLKDAVSPVIDVLKNQFDLIFGSAEESFGGIGGIIETVAGTIANVIKGLTPILELLAPVFNFIKDVAVAVWPVIEGIITVCSQVIKDVVEALKPAFDAVGSIIRLVGETVADIWPKVQETILNVWEKLQPVLELFKTLCQLIADVFAVAWPPISGVLDTLWGIIGPILEGIADVLGKIADAANWAAEKLSGVGDWIGEKWEGVKNSKANPMNWFGGDDKADGQHAAGLDRVPRDGYKAVLHEGERVLTAREAREADNKSNSNVINNTFNVTGVSDPQEVVRLLVQKLKDTNENLKPA